jgi:hypothetical protein
MNNDLNSPRPEPATKAPSRRGVLGVAAGVDYSVKKPRLSFVRFAGIYLLEQIAYGAGVFWGCLRRKTFASYRVVILRQAELSA